jgi:hypothetical protein
VNNNNPDELIKLIKNLINNKTDLLELLDEKGIKLSKSLTYDEIISRVGEKELLKLFGLESVQEGYRKLDILNLIQKAYNLNEVSLLAKELGVQKKSKTENIKEIFLSRNEEQISNAIKVLYKNKKFSGIYQYLKIVSGPKGIIDSCCEHISDVEQFLDSLKESDLKQIYQKLEIEEKASTVDEMKQLILIHSTDENIIREVNKLISNVSIEPPEMPEWSSLIVTSCGLFHRQEEINPKLELRDFLLKNVDKEDLKLVIARELRVKQEVVDNELERYLLEYLLDKSPENIIHSFFDKPDIIRLAERIFKCKPNDDISFDEIINCILSTLGFTIPPKLIGLKAYKEQITQILDKTMFTTDDAATTARETDRILRNLIQFSSKFIWEIKGEEDYTKVISEKCFVKKDFAKLSSGELVRILRVIDEIVRKDDQIKEKLHSEFGKEYIISAASLKILERWVSHRNAVIKRNEKLDRKIIEELIEFADNIKDIYPLIVRVEKEETDKYDTHFIYLIDDKGAEHRISQTDYLEPTPYFMSPSNRTIVDPFIVKIE